jgi:hypothetical protein
MIVTLSSIALHKETEAIGQLLADAFKGHVQVSHEDSLAPNPWPGDAAWDDLLIVVYDGTPFPAPGNDFIHTYLSVREGSGLLLPIALDPAHTKPPSVADAIKAFPFVPGSVPDAARLVQRVGTMLGLRVLHRGTKVFISYRASDGKEIALQLEDRLKGLGYPVWRDEAKEIDGETKILPGTAVQQQIDEALEEANIVILLDTEQAPHSHWIKHEVDTANGLLVPILPVCFRTKADASRGPRFRALRDLQRWVDIELPSVPRTPPLTDCDLSKIISAMEQYVCEIFQRKCRVPFLVQKEFVARDYSWKILDQRLLMCESVKTHSIRTKTRVLSHCSIFEQMHGPGMGTFSAFLRRNDRSNHALYIYDGALIPEPELKGIIESTPPEDGVVILHHQELAALIDSNFTTFTP